jgi:hypothetical protein
MAKEGNDYKLNDNKNPWYKTAYDDFFANSYGNIFVIDNYDLANTALLNKKIIEENDYNKYTTLLAKYMANVVIISVASYDPSSGTMNVIYREIDSDGMIEKKMTYSNKDNMSEDDFYVYVSEKFIQMLDKESKIRIAANKNDMANLAKLLVDNSMEFYILVQDLKEYNHVKDLILNLSFIKKYEIVEFTTQLAKLRIYYTEDESEIISMFENKGFEVKNKGGRYFITYKGFK